jgi:hypothetical protein
MKKFNIGDEVIILDTGSAVSCLVEGEVRYGAEKGDKVIITGITFRGGDANESDPRYYGKNFNLRACGLKLAKLTYSIY